jgi:hypothetical protein
MSRYNNSQNGNNSNNNDSDYEDDKTLKLQPYAALRLTLSNLNEYTHNQYGTSFIVNYDDAEVLDGIVLQRDDKPGTWKIFSAGKFFNLNPEDGLVYEQFDEEAGYSGQMSAQDILEHPRVAGFSESAGGNDYFYTPVGAVIEEAGDVAVSDAVDVETTEGNAINVGSASMLLSNNSWVRTFAKKITSQGDGIINDNGMDPTPRGEDHNNPKYTSHDWLTTDSPTLRSELEGRTIELWVTEQTTTWDDGEETTYNVPNVMDTKTEEFVEIDNDEGADETGGSQAQPAATDGGTKAANQSDSSTTQSPDSPSASSDGLPENVPDKLDDLIDYMARNGETSAEKVRDFAEDEVKNPDEIDWQAAAAEANRRAE